MGIQLKLESENKKNKMPKDELILSYNDSVIRQSDLKLLVGPHWLNDRIISFFFEYLYDKEFDQTDKLVFISPEVSQFLKMAHKKELSVLPVNNSDDPERPGGSHWSLLMFSMQAKEFFHFDSSSGLNKEAAKQLAFRTHSYLQSKLGDNFSFRIKEVPVLQQGNGYDCGVHLLCNAQHATRHLLIYGSDEGLRTISDEVVKKKRSELKELIISLSGTDEEGPSSQDR